ncbi:hypothetical protein MMC31_004757 [Peltigera leucophlebia]|nr:hypothetical protein [Peltigera leucophlebia]
MAINNNSKKARVARARHAAAQRKNRTAPVAPNPPARRSTRRSRRAIPEDSDGSHSEGPEESSHHQSHPPTPEPEGPNPVMPDVETLRATRDALQAQASLAARQGEKSAEVRQLEEEIAKLRSNLTNSVSGQVEGGGYLGNNDGMDPKAISLLVRFPTIHKEQFEDILHSRFKPENILKLSTSFTTIKARVKYIKVGDSIELATHEDESTAGEAKSITQLLRTA